MLFDWRLLVTLPWLGVISWFDLKIHKVPHIAWVAIPLIIAAIYRAFIGNWGIGLLAIAVVLTSERKRIPGRELSGLVPWSPLILFLGWFAGVESIYGQATLLAFWLAWEVGIWGGADALTGITLVLLWPTSEFLESLIIANLVTLLIIQLYRFIRDRHLIWPLRIPGLPVLLLAVIVNFFIGKGAM